MNKIAHIGICVYNVDAVIDLLKSTVGIQSVKLVEMPQRGQKSAYVRLDSGDLLELMEPLGEGGTVAAFLSKHGEGIHHLSFSVESVEESASAFEAAGCRIIGRSKGLAFVHPKTAFGVLYELVDETYE